MIDVQHNACGTLVDNLKLPRRVFHCCRGGWRAIKFVSRARGEPAGFYPVCLSDKGKMTLHKIVILSKGERRHHLRQTISSHKIYYEAQLGALHYLFLRIVCDSDWYRKRFTIRAPTCQHVNTMANYATIKGLDALYREAWARRHTQYKVLTISPGGTSSTAGVNAKALPFHLCSRYDNACYGALDEVCGIHAFYQ